MGITGEWLDALRPEFSKPYYKGLYDFVKNEYASKTVFPPPEQIFSAPKDPRLQDFLSKVL